MSDRPNVVVLLLDAARLDRFSCYGHSRETTPFIDSLAADGTVYDAAYSTSVWSLPAYGSLFTGELPSEHGAVNWESVVGKNTLVSELDDAYSTYCISPHIMSRRFGMTEKFDEDIFAPVPHKELLFEPDPVIDNLRSRNDVSATAFVEEWLSERTFRTFPNAAYQVLKKKGYEFGFWDDSGAQNVFDSVTDEMLDSEPFFLFTNFVETHKPYYVPRKWALEYTDASPAEINRVNRIDSKAATAGEIEISESDRQLLLDLLDGSLRYMDEQIEAFYRRLEAQGVAEDTVFVVLSDHGDLFGEWGVWEHQAVIHRDLCNVPLIINTPWDGPETVSAPTSIRSLCDSIVAMSRGEAAVPSGSNEVFVEYNGWDTTPSDPPWERYDVPTEPWKWYRASCVTDDWRLCWRADDHVELYDTDDRSETDNVSASHPDVVADLKRRIEDRIGKPREIHELYRGKGTHEIDNELANRLEDLGYL